MNMKTSIASLCLLACILQLGAANPQRVLLALDANTICTNPDDFSRLLAETFSNEKALAAADANAVTVAGQRCCMKIIQAIAKAKSYAEQSGKGDAFSSAAAEFELGGCAGRALAKVSTSVSETPTGLKGKSSASLVTENVAGTSGTYVSSRVVRNADGTLGIEQSAGVDAGN